MKFQPRRCFCFVFVISSLFYSLAAFAEPLTRELPNKLREVIDPMPEVPVVSVIARIGVGSADELKSSDPTKNETGVAHHVEHLLFQGNDLFPDQASLIAEFDRLGVQWNAFTSFDKTVVTLMAPSKNLNATLKVLAHMLGRSTLETARVRSESRPVEEEIGLGENNPVRVAITLGEALHAAKGSRLEGTIAGTVAEMQSRDPGVVQNFYRRHYSASNIVLSLVGGIDDVKAVRQVIDGEFVTNIPIRETPPKASIAKQIVIEVPHPFEVVGIQSPVDVPRLLTVTFPLKREAKFETAAPLLVHLLERKGTGSAFAPLFAADLVRNNGIAIVSQMQRNALVFTMVFDLTDKGEKNKNEIIKEVFSVFGSIKAKGVPIPVLAELLKWYENEAVLSTQIDDLAVEHADDVAERGFEKIGAGRILPLSAKPEDIQALAGALSPQTVDVTIFSPEIKGTPNAATYLPVEVREDPAMLKVAQDAFAAMETTVAAIAPSQSLRDDLPVVMEREGLALVYSPEKGDRASAVFKLEFPQNVTRQQRFALLVGMHALDLDLDAQRFFDDASEVGAAPLFLFDPSDMSILIKANGPTRTTMRALNEKIALWRTAELTASTVERAKNDLVAKFKNVASQAPGQRAMTLGIEKLRSSTKTAVDDRVANIGKVTFADVKAAMVLMRGEWAAKGVLFGPLLDVPMATTFPLLSPDRSMPFRPSARMDERQQLAEPTLFTTITNWNRQGVARFFPVTVKPLSKEHFALEIFARVLQKRMMSYVRDERGLLYTPNAGFLILPDAGGALYMSGDTSHRAQQLAMSFSVTLRDLLDEKPMTDDEFSSAFNDFAGEVMREMSGAQGAFNRTFEGLDPREIQKTVNGLIPDVVMGIARDKLDSSVHFDAVAVSKSDPLCQSILTGSTVAR